VIEEGDHDGAIADFTSLLRFRSRLDDDYLDLAYSRRGKALTEKGSYDEAFADLNAALSLKPSDDVALVSRGFVRYERGEFDGALQDFDTALQIDGDFARAYAGRGYALHHKHDYKGAVAAYSKALPLWPPRGLAVFF
jgi:tetratricopeptide (TPR) repeat protein